MRDTDRRRSLSVADSADVLITILRFADSVPTIRASSFLN